MISTEDKIEATAAKEIVLTAGGSQVKITGSGIFMTTSGKFEVKAGQHVFMGEGVRMLMFLHCLNWSLLNLRILLNINYLKQMVEISKDINILSMIQK